MKVVQAIPQTSSTVVSSSAVETIPLVTTYPVWFEDEQAISADGYRIYQALLETDVVGVDGVGLFPSAIQKAAHGLTNGQRIKMRGTTPPAGTFLDSPYFVVNATTNNFQLSDSLAGPPVGFGSPGSLTGYSVAATGQDTTDDTQWVDIGPSNKWAMFDESPASTTTSTTDFTVKFAPTTADTIAFLNLMAVASIKFQRRDNSGALVTEGTVNLASNQHQVIFTDPTILPNLTGQTWAILSSTGTGGAGADATAFLLVL